MSPHQNEKIYIEKKIIRFLLLFMILGVISACVIANLSLNGWFQRWEMVGTVPKNTKEVINGSSTQAYIRTTENKILSCDLYNKDECWIPDVDPTSPSWYAKPCAVEQVAFSPLLNPPGNSLSCIHARIGFAETADDVIYLIDQEHNLWRWAFDRVGGETQFMLMMMLVGAFGGVLLGSILWIIGTLLRRKKSSGDNALFSATQIVYLLSPWMCLLSFLAFRSLVGYLNAFPSSQRIAVRTRLASTEIARQTETAKGFRVQVTPHIEKTRYRFSEFACDAEWISEDKKILCVSGSDWDVEAVRVQKVSSIQMKPIDGLAILIPTRSSRIVEGKFPALRIQDGYHFRATIACIQDNLACNILFDLYLEIQDKPPILLGTWNPDGENKIEEIDIDLSEYSGYSSRFSFELSANNYTSKGNQDVVWIDPRIEE